jgi:hypothetical protein
MGIVFLLGKVESGIVRKKDVLVLMPGKTSVEVVTLANDLTSLSMAKPGENVRIGVKGGVFFDSSFSFYFYFSLFLSFYFYFSLFLSFYFYFSFSLSFLSLSLSFSLSLYLV